MLINSQWFKHANKERKGKDITRLRFFIIFFLFVCSCSNEFYCVKILMKNVFQLFFASFVDVNSIWKLAQRLLLFPCPAFVIQKSHIKFSRSASRYGWHRMTSINNGTSTQIVPLLYRCDSATHTILHELHSFFAVSLFFSFTCRLQGCFHIDKGIFSAIAKQQH